MIVGAPAGGEPKDPTEPDVTIEREIAEVVRGSYARSAATPAKRRIGARELFAEVLDPETFHSWDTALVDVPTGSDYLEQLTAARQASGEDEAVITGEGMIRGRRVCVVACEFAFLGERSGSRRPNDLPWRSSGRPPSGFRSWPRRCRAVRVCRRGPSPSCRW